MPSAVLNMDQFGISVDVYSKNVCVVSDCCSKFGKTKPGQVRSLLLECYYK
jgi:hypothetical protein